MSDNNTWPDPARPGVPTEAGHYWLYDGNYYPVEWTGTHWMWLERKTSAKKIIALEFEYCGPCLDPDEMKARIAEAQREEREECAKACDAEEHRFPPHSLQHAGEIMTCRRLAAAIRARGEKE